MSGIPDGLPDGSTKLVGYDDDILGWDVSAGGHVIAIYPRPLVIALLENSMTLEAAEELYNSDPLHAAEFVMEVSPSVTKGQVD